MNIKRAGISVALSLCFQQTNLAADISGKPRERSQSSAGAVHEAAKGAPNIVANGSFEMGPDPGQFGHSQLGGGSTEIPGWIVLPASVDVNTDWQTPFGTKTIDLNGASAGGIQQSLATETGASYELKFYMASNIGGGPKIKTLNVVVAGQTVGFSFDGSGYTYKNMGWKECTMQFVAKSKETGLAFMSCVPTGNAGPGLDNVSVRKIKESTIKSAQSLSATETNEKKDLVIDQQPVKSVEFTDLAQVQDAKVRKSIFILASQGILDASPDGQFHPNDPVSRGDLTKWMVRVRKLNASLPAKATYSDVSADNSSYKEIEIATHELMVQAYEDGGNKLFKPDQPVTRQGFAMLYCLFADKRDKADKLSDAEVKQYLAYNPTSSRAGDSTYLDATKIADADRKYVAMAQQSNILTQCFGIDPYAANDELRALQPEKNMTRAEAVNILWKLFGQ